MSERLAPENGEIIRPHEVVLTAMAHYPEFNNRESFDYLRGTAAIESIRAVVSAGYQYAVAISAETPLVFTETLPKGTIHCRRYRESDRFDAAAAATMVGANLPEIKLIGHVQPDKNLASQLPAIMAPFADPRISFVIPAREKESFKASYPDFQFNSEIQTNLELHQLLCQAGLRQATDPVLDLMFGVSFYRIKPGIIEALMGIYRSGDLSQKPYHKLVGLGIDVISTARLLKKNHLVANPVIDFRMSPAMVARESGADRDKAMTKRRQQAEVITGGLASYLNGRLEQLPDPLLIKGPPVPKQR